MVVVFYPAYLAFMAIQGMQLDLNRGGNIHVLSRYEVYASKCIHVV
jgi:hypothetical protein